MVIQFSGVALTAGTTRDRNWNPTGKQPARQPHHQFSLDPMMVFITLALEGCWPQSPAITYGHFLTTHWGHLMLSGNGIVPLPTPIGGGWANPLSHIYYSIQ